MNAATALGLLILVTWGSAQAQVGSLPAPPFGYVMSQQSSTLLVVDTRTNDIIVEWRLGDGSQLCLIANFAAEPVSAADIPDMGRMLYASAETAGTPQSATFGLRSP